MNQHLGTDGLSNSEANMEFVVVSRTTGQGYPSSMPNAIWVENLRAS